MKYFSKIPWFGWLPSLCLLAWDSRLTDPAFLPTWIGSIVLLFLLWYSLGHEKDWHFTRSDFILTGFIVWQWISTYWAINKGEAVLNNWRWTILLCSIILMKKWLNKSSTHIIQLRNIIVITTFLYFLGVSISLLVHYYSLGHWQDLYTLQFPSGHKSVMAGIVICLLAINFLFTHSGGKISWIFLVWGSLLVFYLQSRTAFAGWALLMMAVCLEIIHYKRNSSLLRYATAALVLFLCLIIVFKDHPLVQRFNPAGFYYSETAQHRLIAWEKTITIINNHPIFGVGSGNWKVHLPSTGVHPYWFNQEKNREWIFTRAHNDWLENTAELGLIGLGLWLLWVICLVIGAWTSNHGLFRLYILTGLGIYMIISLLDFPKERAEFMLLFTVLAVTGSQNNFEKKIFISRIKISLGVLLMASLFYGLWRYSQELNLKQLLVARSKNDHNTVIYQADKIVNSLFSLDFSGMPIRWYAGVSAFQQGNFQQAKTNFLAAHQVHPFSHQVLNNLGATAWQLADTLESIRWYTRCLDIHPAFEDPRFNLAVIFSNQQKYSAAKDILQPIVYDTIRRREFLAEINRMKKQ